MVPPDVICQCTRQAGAGSKALTAEDAELRKVKIKNRKIDAGLTGRRIWLSGIISMGYVFSLLLLCETLRPLR